VRTVGCDACEQVPGLERYTIELTGPADGVHGGVAASRTVSLYWYSRWVDFPNSASIGSKPFYANAWNALHIALHVLPLLRARGDDHWTVCHCSAGVGRTGTFIALLHVLLRLPALRAIGALDGALRETIEAMRERRLWMVKTDVEFATLYAAILLQLRNLNLADFELSEIGISPDNWAQDDFSFVTSMGMMLFDTVLYTVLGLYLERVLPSKYGARAHPLFCLRPSYWRGGDDAHGLG